MKNLLTSITFGICCILSWVMAGMILEEDQALLKQQEITMEITETEKLKTPAQKTLIPSRSVEKDLVKEQL